MALCEQFWPRIEGSKGKTRRLLWKYWGAPKKAYSNRAPIRYWIRGFIPSYSLLSYWGEVEFTGVKLSFTTKGSLLRYDMIWVWQLGDHRDWTTVQPPCKTRMIDPVGWSTFSPGTRDPETNSFPAWKNDGTGRRSGIPLGLAMFRGDLLVLGMVPSCKLTITNIAMENPPCWWYLPGKMGIFMGYVSLPEGNSCEHPTIRHVKLFVLHVHSIFQQ